MTQPFDVLGYIHDLLQVLVLTVVEDGIINDYAVDIVVGVGGQDGFFDFFFVDVAAGVLETTACALKSKLDHPGKKMGRMGSYFS